MNQIERYCDRELNEMQEICVYLSQHIVINPYQDIYKIALIEINRELDERKIKKEGRNG